MPSQSKKYLTYVIILFAVCLLIIAAAWLMVFKMSQVTNQIKQAKTNLVKWQKKDDYFRQISEDYQKIHSDLETIDQGFLSADQIISFIEKLESLARQTQINQEIKNAAVQEQEPPCLAVDLSLKGSFSKIFHYLVLLENMEYYNKINKVQLTKTGQQPRPLPESGLTAPLASLAANLELIIFLSPKP